MANKKINNVYAVVGSNAYGERQYDFIPLDEVVLKKDGRKVGQVIECLEKENADLKNQVNQLKTMLRKLLQSYGGASNED